MRPVVAVADAPDPPPPEKSTLGEDVFVSHLDPTIDRRSSVRVSVDVLEQIQPEHELKVFPRVRRSPAYAFLQVVDEREACPVRDTRSTTCLILHTRLVLTKVGKGGRHDAAIEVAAVERGLRRLGLEHRHSSHVWFALILA